jgi:hypothetical protein
MPHYYRRFCDRDLSQIRGSTGIALKSAIY